MMARGRFAQRGTSSWTGHVLWPMSNNFAVCASFDSISLCVTQMKQPTDQQRKAGKRHVVRSGNVVYLRPFMNVPENQYGDMELVRSARKSCGTCKSKM